MGSVEAGLCIQTGIPSNSWLTQGGKGFGQLDLDLDLNLDLGLDFDLGHQHHRHDLPWWRRRCINPLKEI